MPPEALAFTKLVVHDLERMVAFYSEAYGLHAVQRVKEHIGDEAIDEVMMSADPEATWSSLVLLAYPGRGSASGGEVILGFTTDDLTGLIGRIEGAGGSIHLPAREMPGLGVRVAFAKDPEGHLAELVELLA